MGFQILLVTFPQYCSVLLKPAARVRRGGEWHPGGADGRALCLFTLRWFSLAAGLPEGWMEPPQEALVQPVLLPSSVQSSDAG